jgi:hypothetical protein
MDRAVAQVLDGSAFVEDGLTNGVAEGWLVNEGAEVFSVRKLKASVVLIGPTHSKLQRAPGIETSGTWIRVH